jgi:hypothetical protein
VADFGAGLKFVVWRSLMSRVGRKGADEALLVALACGASVETAATKVGLHPRTVHRRLGDPEFQKRLRELKDDMVKRTAAMLSAGAMEAVKTLISLLQGSTSPTVRLGAARAMLELSVRLREAAELHERIAALEQQRAERD